ncbi:MAG: tetratricopeptide (TPR) repeat protein [Saprospiraceae bacterium]|jgi:tetratricopeptide (TPR) repeat protein
MKKYLLLLTSVCFIVNSYSQTYINKKGDTHLWGKTTIEVFSFGDYAEWYSKNSKEYKTSISAVEATLLSGIDVEIFVGTWCGDTKFLVPKFIETWKQLGLDPDRLSIMALHNEGSDYKQGPNKETVGKNIHRVPTFIFSKSNKEIGRIVERTVHDLDTDMMLIAKGDPYKERYQGVPILNDYFQNFDGDTLLTIENFRFAMKLVTRELSSSGELNAMGYVLMAQDEIDQAEFTFRLNKYIYPYNPNIIDSYGEFLYKQERYEESLKQYLEVLRIKGEDRNASKMISEIYMTIDQKNEKL